MTDGDNSSPSSDDISASMSRGTTLGLNIFSSVLVGLAIGYGLDYLFATKPLFTLIFLVLGFCAGIYTIWKALQASQVD